MEGFDIFNNDAFSVLSLTDAVNRIPFIPGRAGAVIRWNAKRVATTSIAIEEKNGILTIVNPTPRGGPGTPIPKTDRTMRSLRIPHYEVPDFILADSIQNVREFGSTNRLKTIQSTVNERMAEIVLNSIDPTLEYQRIGAVKGVILNGDGSTLYDLFKEFGITAPAVVDFDLDNAAPVDGAIRKKCDGVIRKIAKALGGVPYGGIYAFCGDNFWDDLVNSAEVRSTYLNQQEASQLREGTAYQTFNYGGITWENYRGAVGDTDFVAADNCHIFPIGVPGLWNTVYAPADYEETVNTKGLPRYAKQYPSANGKGRHLEVQSNALSYCVRPEVLIPGKRT